MLTLTGTVVNLFLAPQGTNKEGVSYGGENKVQLQTVNQLKNGERRVELFTLTTRKPEIFRDRIGQEVAVSVGVFPSGKGLQFFLVEQ